ncbi:GMC family oxidoreductase [Leekyejoonella antrihumi]|uniref:GMC family oxidoreductase n=2 Tax=Leekyejoonella antrihumi TaxID=1660198 RepID=A0A563E413_9MICO|nr:GMC family oxidoreductase [Leekyejoonella antrihumi]
MARALSGRDASVLVLERGEWLPQEKENWDPAEVWRHRRYRTDERWVDRKGHSFVPFMNYTVGGNTKFWGAALFRLRESDFGPVQYPDGTSPAWPIDYETLAPWYDRAEELYHVHGQKGADPTEPDRKPYPHLAVPHEPFIAQMVDRLTDLGVGAFPLPLGLINPAEPGGCLLCDTCNSFPCLLRAKSDADTCGMTPALESDNVALWTGARAERLLTDASGRCVTGVQVNRRGERMRLTAGTVVLAAGAVNSAALLLDSPTHGHPGGLANSSGLVGRHYMAHISTMMEAFYPFQINPTSFQKTVGIHDFYLPGHGRSYPLGAIQSQGRAHAAIVKAVMPGVPMWAADAWVRHGVDWLALTEDLPDPENRVSLTTDGRISLSYRHNNLQVHRELVREAVRMMRRLGSSGVVRHRFKNANTTHQCGTLRFGEDPRTSVLDPYCRTHDIENLFVTDSSFFPSSAAVNPGLTVIAQTLRVADHLLATDLERPA